MRKVVIVPYDQYIFLTTQHFPNRNSACNVLNQDILENNKSSKSPTQFENPCTENESDNNDCDDSQTLAMEKDLILTPFSKNQIRNAESVLKFIAKNMSWNELGELIVRGTVIKGSHVTDLIKDCLSIRERKWDPIGHEYFYGNLFDIPLSLVFNIKRRPLLGSGKTPKTFGEERKNTPSNYNQPVYAKKRKVYSQDEDNWIEQWQGI